MYSTEKELDTLLHDWLHTYPIQEMQEPFNHIVEAFRTGTWEINRAKFALLDHFGYLYGCKRNNLYLAMALQDDQD